MLSGVWCVVGADRGLRAEPMLPACLIAREAFPCLDASK